MTQPYVETTSDCCKHTLKIKNLKITVVKNINISNITMSFYEGDLKFPKNIRDINIYRYSSHNVFPINHMHEHSFSTFVVINSATVSKVGISGMHMLISLVKIQ